MKYCKNCGNQMEDHVVYCPKCGTPSNGQASPELEQRSSGANDSRLMAILAYFGILVLIPLLACRDSKFVRFHTDQGLTLAIAGLLVSALTGLINALDLMLLAILPGLLNLGLLVLSIMGIIHAAKGECIGLPVLGKIHILRAKE